MVRNGRLLFWALAISVLLSSCAKREVRVVARVGGRAITVGDLERVFRARPDWSPEQVDSARTEALDRLIGDKLLALKGEEMGYRDDEEVTKGLELVLKKVMLSHLYRKVVVERVRVGEGEVSRLYNRMGEELKLKQIVVPTKQTADSLYTVLVAQGGDFEELAREHSTDRRTRDKGGDLGWMGVRRLPSELQGVLFSLKKGQTSKPIKTARGYTIARLEDRREVDRRPYEEERVTIRRDLERARMREVATRYLDRLKKMARIEVDEEVLKILAEKTPRQERTRFAPPPLPAITEEDRELVLVRSSVRHWTVDEVLKLLEDMPSPPAFDRIEDTKRYLDGLVGNELLLDKARLFHLDISPEVKLEVQNELDRRMLNKFTREEIDGKVQVSEDELSGYYNAHVDDYTQPERVQVSEVLVKTEEEARQVRKRLRGGEDFAELAKELSLHPSKGRGGDLGLFPRGKYPEIEDIAFSLGEGRISNIIETKDGFAVIKVTRKEPRRVQSFEEVKTRVESVLKMEKRDELKKEILSSLREEMEVVINHRNLHLVGGTSK